MEEIIKKLGYEILIKFESKKISKKKFKSISCENKKPILKIKYK